MATQTPSFIGFPLGVTSGTYSNIYDTTLASTYRAAFITANGGTVAGAEAALFAGLLAGQAYFNIHTVARFAAVKSEASWLHAQFPPRSRCSPPDLAHSVC